MHQYKSDFKITVHTLNALQEASKAHLVGLLQDSNLCTIHVKWITIMPKAVNLSEESEGNMHEVFIPQPNSFQDHPILPKEKLYEKILLCITLVNIFKYEYDHIDLKVA